MLYNPDPAQEPAQEQPDEAIDMLAACRAILRALVHLAEAEYTPEQLNSVGDVESTGHKWRQDEVLKHDDLPDPASARGNSQG